MKIKFHPFLKEARGRFGDTIFRLCHTGEFQITRRPNMSKVKWSKPQQDHRERMAEATAYANSIKRSLKDYPELHACHLQMAWEKKGDKRWFDMAVSDIFPQPHQPDGARRVLLVPGTMAGRRGTAQEAQKTKTLVEPVNREENEQLCFGSKSLAKAVSGALRIPR